MPTELDEPQQQETVDSLLGKEPTIKDLLGPEPPPANWQGFTPFAPDRVPDFAKNPDGTIKATLPGYDPENAAGRATSGPGAIPPILSAAQEGLSKLGARIANIPVDVFNTASRMTGHTTQIPRAEPGKDIISPESVRRVENATLGPVGGALLEDVRKKLPIVAGLLKSEEKGVAGFTEPGQVLILPFAATKPVQALFAAQMAASTPDQIKTTYATLTDPKATAAQKWEALGDTGLHLAMVTGIALHLSANEVRARYTPEEASRLGQAANALPRTTEAAKQAIVEQQPTTTGEPNAEGIREDTGQLGTPGQVREGGEANRGGDIQQTPSRPPEPVGTRETETPGPQPAPHDQTGILKRYPSTDAARPDAVPLKPGEVAPVRFVSVQPGAAHIGWYEPTKPFISGDGGLYYPNENGTVKLSSGQLRQAGFEIPPEELAKFKEAGGVDKPAAPAEPPKEVTPLETEKEKAQGILTPAIRVAGKVFTGKDHVNAYENAKANGQPDTSGAEEGFQTADGKFLTREEAAQQTGLPTEKEPGKLHSSDLPPEPELAGAFPPGPGAATKPPAAGEGYELPSDPGNPDVYGVAARVRDQRAKAGQVVQVEPGKGVAPSDSIERGRLLIERGADPEARLAQFEKDGRLSADDMAIVRAHGERLAQDARSIEEKFGTDSDEYREAWQKLSDWDTRTKKMQTEWHKTGQAQQGETDLDTGTFTGLQRGFREATGEDFNPKQAVEAQKVARKVKVAAKTAEDSKAKLYQQLEMELGRVDAPDPKTLDEARAQFAGFKKGSAMSPQQVKTLWKAARRFYLDRGITDFDDIRNGLATDFGIPVEDVTRGLAQPKGVKRMTDDMYVRQTNARRTVEQAKRWLLHKQMPLFERALRSIPNRLFRIAVGFHGTVALGTHAPMVLFQPPFWKTYVTDFGKMYKMVGSPAYYERQIQDMMRRPNYVTARRAGLVNDPFTYEDYNSPDTAKWIGRLSGMGNRGYSVLKILRQDMFDQHWNALPETARTPEVAEALSDGINHATGVTKKMAPKGANLMLFAPRLEASRAAWLVADPLRAVNTFANWKNASTADRLFAINQVKEKAWVLGTMGALLALNQGILSASGSKQKINLTDPMRSDWLKFKAAGMQVGYGNAMVAMARLPIRLFALRHAGGSGKMAKLIKPDESMSSEAFKYLRSQFSPFAGLLADLAFKGDYENRPLPPMPFSGKELPMPKRLKEQGMKPYTWPEFVTEHALPIPGQEAAREVWRHGFGMSPEQVRSMEKALLIISIMSGTGARVSDDTQPKK